MLIKVFMVNSEDLQRWRKTLIFLLSTFDRLFASEDVPLCNGKNFKHSFHTTILSVAQTFHPLSHFQGFVHDFPLPGTLSLSTSSPGYSSGKSWFLCYFLLEACPEYPSPPYNLAKLDYTPIWLCSHYSCSPRFSSTLPPPTQTLFLTAFWPCRGFLQSSPLPSLLNLQFSWLFWYLSVLLYQLTSNTGISTMKSIQIKDEWKRPWWKDQCNPQCHRQWSNIDKLLKEQKCARIFYPICLPFNRQIFSNMPKFKKCNTHEGCLKKKN